MSPILYSIQLKTENSSEFISITNLVQSKVDESGVSNGIIVIFCPHTTAAITINENADPDVVRDMLYGLDKVFPENSGYKHFEGNSHAHLKASTIGMNETVIINHGKLTLGTWQGIYFCEFDGPRTRSIFIKILEG